MGASRLSSLARYQADAAQVQGHRGLARFQHVDQQVPENRACSASVVTS